METTQAAKDIKYVFFQYSQSTTRNFNCNHLFFKNLNSSAGNVTINNAYVLAPGEYIELFSNLNETDTTVYQITIPAHTKVQGWSKMDMAPLSATITDKRRTIPRGTSRTR